MTTSTPVATTRTDVSAAIVLLLIAEATLFFTFLFVVGPIATLTRLLPLLAVLALSAALYWGQTWARWAPLAPSGIRVWRLAPFTAAACALGPSGLRLFLTPMLL